MFWRRPITLVNARVITPEGRLAKTLRVKGSAVDGIDVPPRPRDVVLDVEDGYVFPGLINAHDHLELNSQPRLKWRQRYSNASEWIADFQPRFATDPALAVTGPSTLEDRLWVGGLKNLLAGVTTVCHHNPLHRPLRKRFPVRVVRHFGFSHSLYIDGDAVVESHQRTPSGWPWMIHAGEGVDERARQELDTLQRLRCLSANTVFIHGVAFEMDASKRVIDAGAGLVWCPSSNHFLFGATADVNAFHRADRLALGSDSRLSGERDLLHELKAAHATRQLSAEGLWRTVSNGAARLLKLQNAGRLAPGMPADLVVLRPLASCPFEALVRASRTDIRLVVVNGTPAIGEPALAPAFDGARTATMAARLDGVPRVVSRWIGQRVVQMRLQEPGFEVQPERCVPGGVN